MQMDVLIHACVLLVGGCLLMAVASFSKRSPAWGPVLMHSVAWLINALGMCLLLLGMLSLLTLTALPDINPAVYIVTTVGLLGFGPIAGWVDGKATGAEGKQIRYEIFADYGGFIAVWFALLWVVLYSGSLST